MSDANLAGLAYVTETTLGNPSSAAMTELLFTKESFKFDKETVTSQLIRNDRQVQDSQKVFGQASGGFETEVQFGAILPFLELALQADWVEGTITPTVEFSEAAQTMAGSAGDFATVPAGAVIKITLAATAGNNGLKRVVSKNGDSSVLTLAPGSITADGTADVLSISFKTITNGKTRKSIMIEKRLVNGEGQDYFQRFGGLVMDTLELTIESKKVIGASMNFVGTSYEIADASYDAGYVGAAASRVLTLTGNAVAGETVTIGGQVYTWRAVADEAGEVTIGANASASIDNLIDAIAGDLYNVANIFVTATAGAGDTMLATAITPGVDGNAIAVLETMTLASWASGTLTGGVDLGTGYSPAAEGAIMNGTNNLGTIKMDGATASDRFKQIKLSLANNVRGKDACGFEGNWDIGLGQFNAKGSLNAYFRNNSLPLKAKNHTAFGLDYYVQDVDGNRLYFYLAAAKPSGDPSITGINTDVMIEMSFDTIKGTTAENPTGQMLIIDAVAAA